MPVANGFPSRRIPQSSAVPVEADTLDPRLASAAQTDRPDDECATNQILLPSLCNKFTANAIAPASQPINLKTNPVAPMTRPINLTTNPFIPHDLSHRPDDEPIRPDNQPHSPCSPTP
ncbi:MAG: hypothetical protein WAU10_08270 [Caldilineaceae bacterium]